MEEQQHGNQAAEDFKLAGGIIRIVMECLACGPVVFTHQQVGDRYVLARAPVHLVLIFLFSIVYPRSSPSPLFSWYAWAFLALAVAHLVNAHVLRARGDALHSQGPGWPCEFWYKLGFGHFALAFLEPGIWFLVAIWIQGFDPRLGTFLLFAGAAFFGAELMLFKHGWRHKLDALDSRVEGRMLGQVLDEKPRNSATNTAHVPGTNGRVSPKRGSFLEQLTDILSGR